MKAKLKLGIILFLAGFLGVLSLLTVSLQLNLPEEVTAQMTPEQLKLILLINPTILLLISVVVGTILYDKVKLTAPTISEILDIETHSDIKFKEQAKFGIWQGIVVGILILVFPELLKMVSPEEYASLSSQYEPSALAKLLYGGITEELMLRFGFMTFIVWLIFKISKKLTNATYWTAIILAAIIFAIAHFPVVFGLIPDPSVYLLGYVLLANSIAGFFFGWLYWKKGIEAAIIAHMFAHIPSIVAELIIG